MEMNQRDLRQPWLQHLWLELTSACNLHCGHCYSKSGPHKPLTEDMQFDDWSRVLDDAHHMCCRSVQFIGGEPTIIPFFKDLLQYSRNVGIDDLEVFTNATRIKESTLDVIQSTDSSVACSFYSSDPSVHDKITARSGSFSKTIDNIARILERGINLRVAIIEMDLNSGHAAAAQEVLEQLGVDRERIRVDFVRPFGRASTANGNRYKGLCGQCWKGRLCIAPDGSAYPCIMSRDFLVGNVLETGLEALLTGAQLQHIRKDIASHLPAVTTSCTPMDCTPNRYCGPDGLCGPGYVDADEIQSSCTPMDCTPNRYCGPDGLCGPGVVEKERPFGERPR